MMTSVIRSIRSACALALMTTLLGACATAPPTPVQLATPGEADAQLVVYRHGGPLRTGVIRPELHIGPDRHGPVYPTAYRSFLLPPGEYTVWAGLDDSRGARITLAPGQTRYVRVIVELDHEARGAQIIEVDADTARATMETLVKLE